MPDSTVPDPAVPDPAVPDPAAPSGLRRMWQALRVPRRGQAVVGVLLALVGFGAVTTVRANVDDASYAGYRQQDLIDLLSGLAGTSQRAQAQLQQLTRTRHQLESATNQREAALSHASQELDTLRVLAGTVPVQGPGITVTITEITGQVTVDDFLDLIEELRSNGAEALDVNGRRIVAQTSFDQDGDGLLVSGKLVNPPYVVTAIGEPTTLAAAVTFTRGPGYELRSDGAQVDVAQSQSLTIHSTVPATSGGAAGTTQGQ